MFDLLIGKVDSIDPVAVGEDTVYTLRAGNRGPSTAENVVVTDTLPTSLLSFQSISFPPDATCTVGATRDVVGGTISCVFPFLAARETRDIIVTMRGVAKGVAVNRASVAADGSASFDTELGNNTTSQNTTVRTRSDVEVTSKVPSNPDAEHRRGAELHHPGHEPCRAASGRGRPRRAVRHLASRHGA